MIDYLMTSPSVCLIASDANWIEGDAIAQLKKTALLEGIISAAGMPDIHPGKGSPVGAAFLSKHIFYPHIIGNDAGCGMSLFQTTIKTKKIKQAKWAKALHSFPESPTNPETADPALGTLGGGNHFAELQKIETVYNDTLFQRLGADTTKLFLLIHCGSRGLGESLYRSHTGKRGVNPLSEDTDEGDAYLARYHHALTWASNNRAVMAERFMACVGGRCESLLDLCHNSISKIQIDGIDHWLHRKGAVSSTAGPVMIPGSRGDLTYLVNPTGPQAQNLWSVAHGAGRKWNRSSCKGKLKRKWSPDALKKTDLGSVVVCENRDLIYEEAPQAYKKIGTVIDTMVSDGLIEVIATFRPVLTYKTGDKK